MSGPPIQNAPPNYDAAAGSTNEKLEYMNVGPERQPQQTYQQNGPQHSYPQQPQQTFQQNGPQPSYHQQEAPKQGFPQNNASRNNYQTATPLASLQQGPAPVDCPACGVREMTRTEFVSGGTTQ